MDREDFTVDQCFEGAEGTALDIARHARSLGVRFDWVGFDAFYGNAPHLHLSLDADGERFMADVHQVNGSIWKIPSPKPNKQADFNVLLAQVKERHRRR